MGVHLSVDFFRVIDDEMVWDEYHEDFKTIVAQAEKVLQLSPVGEGASFTLNTEVIMPLASVAFKDRNGQLRRKAIALMRSAHRQEGIWNSLLTARVAERAMEIEEDGLDGVMVVAASIPKWNRVHGIQVALEKGNRRAHFQYTRPKRDGGMETTNEWIEWFGLGAQ
jgi:hypothetical protein